MQHSPQEDLLNTKSDEHELKTIAKGGGIGLVGNFAHAVLALVFQMVVARTLGPAQVGDITFSMTLSDAASVLLLLGTSQGVLRFVAYYMGQNDRSRAAGTILSALRILAIASLTFLPLIYWKTGDLAQFVFKKPYLTPILQVLVPAIPFLGLTLLLTSVMQAFKRLGFVYLVQTIVQVAQIGGILFIVLAIRKDAVGAAYALLGASVLGAVVSSLIIQRLYPLRNAPGEKPILVTRTLLDFSWPLMLTALLIRLNAQSEILVMGALAPSEQVGIYTTALQATRSISIFLIAINTIFAPVIAELYARDPGKIQGLYQTVTRWAFMLSLPVFTIFILFSKEVLLLFGEQFTAGIISLQLLTVAQLIFIVTGPSASILTMAGYPKLNLFNTILTLATSLVMDFTLIPRYGATGAAIAGTVSISLVNILRVIELYLILRIQPYNWTYLKPILAGLAATAAALGAGFLFRDSFYLWKLSLAGLAFCLVYLPILLALRFEEADRLIFDTILKRLRQVRKAS